MYQIKSKNIKVIKSFVFNRHFLLKKANKNFQMLIKKKFTTKKDIKNESKHIDEKDDDFFKTIKDWWNPEGSMKTLHYFNDLRIEYILNMLKNSNELTQNELDRKLPLENIRILDVGCGGGLLTEVY